MKNWTNAELEVLSISETSHHMPIPEPKPKPDPKPGPNPGPKPGPNLPGPNPNPPIKTPSEIIIEDTFEELTNKVS